MVSSRSPIRRTACLVAAAMLVTFFGATQSLSVWAQVPTPVLYGGIGEFLVEIDRGTGAATLLGQHTDPIIGMAFSQVDATMYAVAWTNTGPRLLSVNLSAGALVDIGPIRPRGTNTTPLNLEAFAYNANDEGLYAALGTANSRSRQLMRLDTATAEGDLVVTISGTIENEADGMEFVNGVPYIVDIGLPAILYSLNLSTGVASIVGNLSGSIAGNSGAGRDMAFDVVTGTLYMTSFGIGASFADQVMTLDWTTGQAAVVGRTHAGTQFNGRSLQALALGPARNAAPSADAGQDLVVECAGPTGTAVTLNGLLSEDPDGDALQFTWTDAGGAILAQGDAATAGMPTVTLGEGTHTITLTVMDPLGLMSSDTVQVTVQDTTAPAIADATPRPSSLWPPNHKMRRVSVSVAVSDGCGGAVSCRIVSVSSNEPVNGNGDGNTAPDWEITGDLTVELRAERSGSGNGRVYTITLECEDDAGNVSSTSTEVTVPKSRGRK